MSESKIQSIAASQAQSVYSIQPLQTSPYHIALIAHDNRKQNLVDFVSEYKQFFERQVLYATGTTGQKIHTATGLPVHCFKSGPIGGDQQIGALIASEKIDMVFLFRDPLSPHPHEPDVSALLRLCDVYHIPLATNIGTAKLFMMDLGVLPRSAHNKPRSPYSEATTTSPNLSRHPTQFLQTSTYGTRKSVGVSALSLSSLVNPHGPTPSSLPLTKVVSSAVPPSTLPTSIPLISQNSPVTLEPIRSFPNATGRTQFNQYGMRK